MSIYHYLFDEPSGRCVPLGKKGRRVDHRYGGPGVTVGTHRYLLPAPWLDLLLERFQERHPDARFVHEGELEATLAPAEAAQPEAELLSEVGGDANHDIALGEYLPEVESPEFVNELESDPALRIR